MLEKIWLKSYPPNMPHSVEVHRYQNVLELFENSVQQFADRPAFHSLNVELTYHELQHCAQHFARFLMKDLQLKKGDRVAIMLPNVLQYPVALLGILYAGCIAVNVNPLYTPDELTHQLKDAEVTAIVVLDNFAHVLEQSLQQVAVPHVIVTSVGDLLGPVKGRLINFVVRHVKKMVPQWKIDHAHLWNDIFVHPHVWTRDFLESLEPFVMPTISPGDIAFLQYTGGTTGTPKGAELTHANLLANIAQSITWMSQSLVPGQEVVTAALPLYHVFSLTVCCFCFLSIGGKCLLISDARDLPMLINTLHEQPPSIFIGLNTLFRALMAHPDFHKINFSRLKLTVAGGMPTNKIVADEWQQKTGVVVTEGYGLTEASPIVCINPVGQTTFTGSIGLPIPDTDVDLRDDAGKTVPLNEPGELWVKGPQVMKGYWRNDDATKKVIDSSGWLATGDIARMDELGFLFVVDRLKDMILVSGFKVFPSELENVLLQHPGIAEAAAVGVPSAATGEAVKVFIVRRDPALTEKEIVAYCHQHLTGYKIPKLIEFCNNLPKSNIGKVLKRKLVDAPTV